MKLGIIGLPQTGKKTLFTLLTGSEISENMLGQKKPIPGFAEIRDTRFDKLVNLYEPKKEGPAKIDIQLMPDFELNTKDNDEIYRELGIVDAICLVIRDFINDSVYHVSGSVDPLRDIESIYGEFILHDLIFIEKRLERIEKSVKKKDDRDTKTETELLIQFKDQLEKNLPLRTLEINSDQLKLIQSYPFLTRKELLIIINTDDDRIAENSIIEKISQLYSDHNLHAVNTSLEIETEISSLDEEEKKEFMDEIGLNESSLEIITQLSMKSLGLISFFTVGKDEVKQWLVRKNSTAPLAASVIHSDIQRGFIRAEVMKYDELINLGNEDELKKAGKLLIMGKDYLVEDGDIISFRFNV